LCQRALGRSHISGTFLGLAGLWNRWQILEKRSQSLRIVLASRYDFAMNAGALQDGEDELMVPPVIGRDITLVGERPLQEELPEEREE